MCPKRFVPESYDPEKLRILQQVFDSVWDQVSLQYPSGDTGRDEELRTELARAIVAEANEGVTDPVELGRVAVMALERRFGRNFSRDM
jgi:hypothetical protein